MSSGGRSGGESLVPAAGRWVARNRRNIALRKCAGLCRRYMSWFSNVDYDLRTNGESFVLETLSRFNPAVLFDAGANIGDWSAAAHQRCPTAVIHAFEISPVTYESLAGRFARSSAIKCSDYGLGDRAGGVLIRHYDGAEALTTMLAYPHPFPFREIRAKVTTGASYAEQHGIEQIDLLKIDVEGMEEAVLRGFDPLFAAGRIGAVQFEYGRASIVNRFLLRDFHDFFEQRDFHVGKIYPNYIDFRPYDMGDEDFLGPNYLACHRSRGGYYGALKGNQHAGPA